MLDEKTGWQVCSDTALEIRKIVAKDLESFGHLTQAVVAVLRRGAKSDHEDHVSFGFSDRLGGGKAAQPKRK